MLPLINPAPFLWFLLLFVATLIGAVTFFLGILKGKEIEARLQKRSQKLTRSILGGVFSEQVAPFLPDFPKDLKASEASSSASRSISSYSKGWTSNTSTKWSSSR